MSLNENTTNSKEKMSNRDKALDYCDELIAYYKKSRILNRKFSKYSQMFTLFFAGITPIVILFEKIPNQIQAIPPVLASISASLAIFKWHETWIACKASEEALKFEKLRFELKTTKLYEKASEEESISLFFEQIHRIHQAHLSNWTELMSKSLEDRQIEKYKINSETELEMLMKPVNNLSDNSDRVQNQNRSNF